MWIRARKFDIKIFLFIMAIIRNMFMSGFQYRISTKLVYKLFLSEFHEMFAIKIKIYFVCLFSFTWPFASIKYMVWVMQWDRNCYNIPMLKFHHARHTFSWFFLISSTCENVYLKSHFACLQVYIATSSWEKRGRLFVIFLILT